MIRSLQGWAMHRNQHNESFQKSVLSLAGGRVGQRASALGSRTRLPSLDALRVFEAAARHASFTKAAEELHVTQAAVSHQVKALEERLGVALFVRRPRGLEITGEGQALLPDLRDAFDRMTNALERVGRKANSGTLNVSLVTTFALGWLAPRLHRFQSKHP